jgi:3-isopropylmalate dehydrogenase
MEFDIAVLPGDGIGPEVITQGVKVLEAVGARFGHCFRTSYAYVGGVAIDKYGTPLPENTVALAKKSSAVLFGAVGGPKWDDARTPVRPEQGILGLRKSLGLFANLRPVKVYQCLANASPLKPQLLNGVDMVVVRELTGGLYYAKPKRQWKTVQGRRGVDTMRYTEREVTQILRMGFEMARRRRGKLTSVDKANVLETSRLWREIATEIGREYPDVLLEHMLVDSCAMQLIVAPGRFDVIVTENTFGDILSDEAGVLSASLGMMPSASLGASLRRRGNTRGLYEPIHGTAPDIVGQGKANPLGTILSVALMLRYSLELPEESLVVERSVEKALVDGCRTADIASAGESVLTTTEMGDTIAKLVLHT